MWRFSCLRRSHALGCVYGLWILSRHGLQLTCTCMHVSAYTEPAPGQVTLVPLSLAPSYHEATTAGADSHSSYLFLLSNNICLLFLLNLK